MRYFVMKIDPRPLIAPLFVTQMAGFLFIGSFLAVVDRDPFSLASMLVVGIPFSMVGVGAAFLFCHVYPKLASRFGYLAVELSPSLSPLDEDARGSECHTDNAFRTHHSRCRQMP
ncbi:MAG: hypothetical protein IJN28_07445 [Selenomonadales bacterium]|nr:hypothetical protein [Selenomonadales bacterium]